MHESVATEIITVPTRQRTYDVHVGAHILEEVGPITRKAAGGTSAAVISDSNVGPLYARRVLDSLEGTGYATAYVEFEAGERNKRLSTVERMLNSLAEAELGRKDVVVALGGGVTGDMAGLAAAMYLRGIQVVQIPTSLLAMVDSSVGGKCAVDLASGKNLAGAFLQPSTVIADVELLHSLSPELFADSVGEVIKHGVLADPKMFAELEARPLTLAYADDAYLAHIVARNIAIKRDVVSADEFEQGLRQTLNLGHTLGHAIEAASDYALGHGSSVAAGLCFVARAAERMGWTDETRLSERIVGLCAAHGLPTDSELDVATIMSFAVHDKKRHGQTVNLVVPRSIGKVDVRTTGLDELERVVCLGYAEPKE